MSTCLAGDDGLDAAVLRDALFGDIHAADDLDAGDDGRVGVFRRGHDFLQHAVQAHADAHLAFGRLDVDITGVDLDGVLDDRVDQLDDRRVGDFIGDLLGDPDHLVDIEFFFQLLGGLLGVFLAVAGVDGRQDLRRVLIFGRMSLPVR